MRRPMIHSRSMWVVLCVAACDAVTPIGAQPTAPIADKLEPRPICPTAATPASTSDTKGVAPCGKPGEAQVEPRSGLTFVALPSGKFHFGCEPQDTDCGDNAKPGRDTWIAGFWMSETETTVAAYRKCVDSGSCTTPGSSREWSACNWESGRDSHPINCVNYWQAQKFCAWIGGRLPNSDEWEYAAKGGESRIFPWGDSRVTEDKANFGDAQYIRSLEIQAHVTASRVHLRSDPHLSMNQLSPALNPDDWKKGGESIDDGYGQTAPVGSYPNGDSKFGLHDMAGNVREWMASSYESTSMELGVVRDQYFEAYKTSRAYDRKPSGPAMDVRGGDWGNGPLSLGSAGHTALTPTPASNRWLPLRHVTARLTSPSSSRIIRENIPGMKRFA